MVGVSAEPHKAGTNRRANNGIPSGYGVPILSKPKLPWCEKNFTNIIIE